jgi:acyl-homoserine lactone acylase PvdQ
LVAIVDDAYSPWAAPRLGPLVEALGDRDELPDEIRDPYAFLRGWDARYTPDAIGASVFEAWLATYEIATGSLPPAAPDSGDAAMLRWTLSIATSRLRQAYGPEPAGWRWDRVQRGRLVFPVWSARDATRAAERYATVPTARGGHPTTLLAGPSLVLDGAPGIWTLWSTASTWARPTLRRPEIETQGFLARARSTERQGAALEIDKDVRPDRVLRLTPAAG